LVLVVEVHQADLCWTLFDESGLFEDLSCRRRLGFFVGKYLATGITPFSLPEETLGFLEEKYAVVFDYEA